LKLQKLPFGLTELCKDGVAQLELVLHDPFLVIAYASDGLIDLTLLSFTHKRVDALEIIACPECAEKAIRSYARSSDPEVAPYNINNLIMTLAMTNSTLALLDLPVVYALIDCDGAWQMSTIPHIVMLL
jgi:hypothetical protein